MPLVVMVVAAAEEEVLVSAVRRKGHGRDAQPGEPSLQPVPPAKLSLVSPCLTEQSEKVESAPCAAFFRARGKKATRDVLRGYGMCVLTVSPTGRISAGLLLP